MIEQYLLHEEAASKVTVDQIQKKVSDYYKIRFSELIGRRRTSSIVFPRQVAMYLTKMLTALSYPEIGRQFGGRDHTTVIHAVRAVEGFIASDSRIAEDVQLLKSLLAH